MTRLVRDIFQGCLSTYLHDLNPNLWNQTVTNITSDSREVRPGSIFVAIQGESQDGRKYIGMAEKAGAILIILEKSLRQENDIQSIKTPILYVDQPRLILSHLASAFFDHPSKNLLMLGVTGTSGKTTITYLLESILKAAGLKVGVIGTINFRYLNKIIPASHTTPGPVELQGLLYEMKQAGCEAVVMEVSSHALKQQRVASIAFDGMIFTHLTPEHLDYHSDMEDYFLAKASLFTDLAVYSQNAGKHPVGVVGQDFYGQRLMQMIRDSKSPCDVSYYHLGKQVQITPDGIRGEFCGVKIQSSLTGYFNSSNIGAAVSLAQALKINEHFISLGIAQLRGVPGRLEKVENNQGIHVWVDYAHKPDALEKVLHTLQEIQGSHRLILVFGCGGDRDRKKRPMMGSIAVREADFVWITSDNPRNEKPMEIIEEILNGVEGFDNFQVEVDRRRAIFQAIKFSKPGDLVLIAGKGHENYQILGTKKVHFDDREVVNEALSTF